MILASGFNNLGKAIPEPIGLEPGRCASAMKIVTELWDLQSTVTATGAEGMPLATTTS
jgi:hypothetical protein